MIGAATFRLSPSDGHKCILKPGEALISSNAPLFSLIGTEMSSAIISSPQILSSINLAILSAKAILYGWTLQVTSIAVPPELKFAVSFKDKFCPSGITESSVKFFLFKISIVFSSTVILVRIFSWWRPRFGSLLMLSISFWTEETPSPVTIAGMRFEIATNL